MAIITIPNTFSAGAVIIASQHNSNFTTIYSDYNGNIDNTNIAPAAAIAYTKLNLTASIVNADISSSAAIVASKLVLTSPGSIGTVAPAAGKFTTLEATTTLKLGTTNQGDVIYDNGTSLVRLPPGTSGQALITGGAGANPAWGGMGMTFVSATAVAAANTTNIAITATKQYMVIANVSYSSGNITAIQFNADTGNNYKWLINGRTSSGALTGGGTATNTIQTGTSPLANTQVNMVFYIFPQSGNQMQAHGHISYVDTAGSLISFTDFAGYWDNSAAVTSFRLISQSGATITGNVYLYSMAQA